MECPEDKCSECIWNWGAIRHHCHTRGGDATYEASGGMPTVKEFTEYELGDGPLHKLKKEEFDSDGKLRIKSKRHEKRIFGELGVHAMERGEMVCDIKMELKDRPAEKIYSFIKGSTKGVKQSMKQST